MLWSHCSLFAFRYKCEDHAPSCVLRVHSTLRRRHRNCDQPCRGVMAFNTSRGSPFEQEMSRSTLSGRSMNFWLSITLLTATSTLICGYFSVPPSSGVGKPAAIGTSTRNLSSSNDYINDSLYVNRSYAEDRAAWSLYVWTCALAKCRQPTMPNARAESDAPY